MSITQDAPEAHLPHVTAPPAVTGRDVRWIALAVLAISQLMIVLDATIVNVALNDIQSDLGFTGPNLQWVINGYTLAFGGFLLLGGRLADRLGRRRMFMVGASLFAFASLLGGLAETQGLLIAARSLQGLGGAVMAPAALSLLTVVFAEGRDRDRALGLWAAISAGGAAIGLILGGVLTQNLSWEWVLWVNVPIAVLAVLGARAFLPESRDENAKGFDVAGAVLGTGGLVALVYALVRAGEAGWTSSETLLTLALAAALLAVFGVLQSRREDSLLPTRLLRNRSVLGADLGALMIGTAIFAIFYFLSIFFGQVLDYDPIRTGLAFLPMTLVIGIGAGIASNLLGSVGPRPLLVVGTLISASGLALLARISPDSSYVGTLLPSLLLVALGMGLAFVALTSAAVAGVPDEDSGIASALLNAGQQIGGALGLAVLTAVSTARTESLFGGDSPSVPTDASIDAMVSGWALGFLVAAGIMVLAGVVMGTMVKVDKAAAAEAAKRAVAA
jgi:EmrB/QacA subfamily drug resistance transporter